MINQNYLVVFDFETGGLRSDHHEAVEVAGKAYDPRTLDPVPPSLGGEFCSLMRPLHPDRLEAGALAVNKKTVAELMAAPDQKQVWLSFVEWVGRFNPRKNFSTAPIACGKNIRNFDMGFVHALNRLHCPKGEKTLLFSKRRQIDLEDFLFAWHESDRDLERESMDDVREYYKMSKEGAHSALVDVRQTGELITRYLKLHRRLLGMRTSRGEPLIQLRGSLEGVC